MRNKALSLKTIDRLIFLVRSQRVMAEVLRSQIVISKRGRGGRRYLPYAFTEQGVAMLSSVLRSRRAIHQITMPPEPPRKQIGFHSE